MVSCVHHGRDAVRRGILLLNYPLSCSPARKMAHIRYGWNDIIKRIIGRLLYRADRTLLLVAWNSDAFKLYTDIVRDWIPNINSSCFTSPSYKNVKMIVATGPDKNIASTVQDDKYHKLSIKYEFNNEYHKTIMAQHIHH